MRILSVNVGRPALVAKGDRTYSTAMNRRPAEGSVWLAELGFEGDRVADAENHGGPDRAVCCYAHEHYPHFSAKLGVELPVPSFGENLTTRELLESEVCIGDLYALGGAVVQVSQPRQPCWKLADKHGEPRLPQWIVEAAFTGFYLRVVRPGPVEAGVEARLLDRPHPGLSVALTARSVLSAAGRREDLARLAELPELSAGWRSRAAKRLRGF
ncbi:MAG: MOSC domain-containing protein [Phycisphaerae bacterium]|jgi:MOSC domain-containing protein YiiM